MNLKVTYNPFAKKKEDKTKLGSFTTMKSFKNDCNVSGVLGKFKGSMPVYTATDKNSNVKSVGRYQYDVTDKEFKKIK